MRAAAKTASRRVSATALIRRMRAQASPANVAGMTRFGINPRRRLGLSMPELRRLAKATGHDHSLALRLWASGVPEACIVASLVAEPDKLTAREMDAWVRSIDSWDVCDQACMNLFEKSPLADRRIVAWSGRREEFVRRAAFALMACIAWHHKSAPDRRFTAWLPLIRAAATDERNFVRKAVNWALRSIGRRNLRLNAAALRTCRALQKLDSRSARWIAADALRELEARRVALQAAAGGAR